jgi:hypothetical protein
MKFVENMTTAQRKDAAKSVLVIEGGITIGQSFAGIVIGDIAYWLVAMLAVVLGAIGWVILTPDECEICDE